MTPSKAALPPLSDIGRGPEKMRGQPHLQRNVKGSFVFGGFPCAIGQ